MIIRSVLLVLMAILAMGQLSAVADEAIIDELANSSPFDLVNADRTILVTFADRSIERVNVGASISGYRRRGPYRSSTWSQRVAASIAKDHGLVNLAQWPMTELQVHCVVYQIPQKRSVKKVFGAVARDKRVEAVQLMGIFRMQAQEYDDPYFKLQSGLHKIGIERLHEKTTGRNITIGVIDTGVDYGHPDLNGQISAKENFVSEICTDFTGDVHGTAVAGIIAARANNGAGIVGMAPDSKLNALKACWYGKTAPRDAICNSFSLALAVNTAIKTGVDILNMSLTGPEDSLLMKLLNRAVEKGIIVVAAEPSGNNPDSGFPASMNNVIAVRDAHTQNARMIPTGNLVSAPGNEILTTMPQGAYDFLSGSSMATAHVSGFIALLLELKPGLSPPEVLQFLQGHKDSDIFSILQSGNVDAVPG